MNYENECCIPDCHNDIGEHGHNALPLMSGRCCDRCNEVVVGVRLQMIYGEQEE